MKRNLKAAAGVAVVWALSGCAGSPSFLAPGSDISSHQARLYRILIYLSIAVFLFVEVWLVYNVLRFRSRPGDEALPKQIYGNNRLEVVWTGIPVLLVAALFGLTVSTVNAVSAPQPAQDDLSLRVVGHQWWWEFDYPDLGIITANELHVPANATVQITLNSVDVIHSFWIPQLSGKIDVVPGQTNHQKPPAQPQTDLQFQGQKIVTTGICNSCHTVGDNQAENDIGPNLTHLMSRSVFAGAVYELNEDNLHHWMVDNQEMKPGNDMSINPKPDEIEPILAYLTTLK
ncbi:MAG: cytochrome c oxidase subunit II [Anaerolineales bacterium]